MDGKGCLIVVLLITTVLLAGAVGFFAFKSPEIREVVVEKLSYGSGAQDPATDYEGPSKEKPSGNQRRRVVSSSNGETIESVHDKVYNQYFDADEAFAKDELFAVTGKQIIREKYYTDHFDKDVFGKPREKKHPRVFIVRCMGRETRENYMFIVPKEFHDRVKIYQKFTNVQLSNFEYFSV